jgi:hypothetical protein
MVTRKGGLFGRRTVATAMLGLLLTVAATVAPAIAAPGDDRIFTVGNYPVEARAANAVAAKEKAIAEGQQAALRSLLKRLVPVTSYKRLAALKTTKAGDLIESFAVRSERNSSTDYVASYDFVFSPEPVRRLLEREGIPYLDRQAPTVIMVPVYRVTKDQAAALPPTFAQSAGSDAWLYAWKALDVVNTLTPLKIEPLKSGVHADTVNALAEGNLAMLRTLTQAYGVETVVLAVLEPDPAKKKLVVTLVGRDAVQTFQLRRSYRLDGNDLAYAAELSAVMSLAIIEGRWKAINVRSSRVETASSSYPGGPAPGYGAPGGDGGPAPVARPEPGFAASEGGAPMTIAVEFQGMGEWQEISRQLAQTQNVNGLEVLGLSARGARVSLSYPGGPQNLALALASRGLILENTRNGWRLARR